MGKKSSSSSNSTSSSTSNSSTVNPTEQNKTKSKGHRQRGAGTVIVSPPPVVTTDGVFLAPHMRLPSTLLQEFCQKEKYPKPVYQIVESSNNSYRMSVSIVDPKNSRNNLLFLPNEGCNSERMSKDYAALLALHHFQSNLPLERKLPEPYSTTWLHMISTQSKSQSSSTSITQSSSSSLTSKLNSKINSNSNIESNSNLIGTNGGNSNISSISTSSSITTTNKTKINNNNNNNSTNLTISQKTNQLNPILGLQSEYEYASISQKEQNEIKQRVESRIMNNTNNEVSILPCPIVDMTNVMKELLLTSLTKFSKQIWQNFQTIDVESTISSITNSVAYSQEIYNQLQSFITSEEDLLLPLQYLTDTLNSFEENSVKTLLTNLYEKFTQDMIDIGFNEQLIQMSVTSILIEYLSKNWNKPQSLFYDYSRLKSLLLERLCLVVEESLLPKSFIERNEKTKLPQVYIPLQKSQKLIEKNDGNNNNNNNNNNTTSLLFLSYGFSPKCCQIVSSLASKKISSINQENYLCSLGILVQTTWLSSQLLSELPKLSSPELENFIHSLSTLTFSSLNSKENMNLIFEEEVETLKAIYENEISINQNFVMNEIKITSIQLDLTKLMMNDRFPSLLNHWRLKDLNKSNNQNYNQNLLLEIYLPYNYSYPASPPLSLIKCTSLQQACPYLLSLQHSLWLTSIELIKTNGGESGIIYNLVLYVEEWLLNFENNISNIENYTNLMNIIDEKIDQEITTNELNFENQTLKKNMKLEETIQTSQISLKQSKTSKFSSTPKNKKVQNLSDSFWGNQIPSIIEPQKGNINERENIELLKSRKKLPAWNEKENILNLLQIHSAIIITGETGCGKTTQIPQFLIESNPNAKVVVCQPRRLAAIGVANRVAQEQGCQIGDLVGHSVRRLGKYSSKTRLLFCTYGILLKRLQTDKNLSGINYIVFDEVHERGVESDFALSLILNILKENQESSQTNTNLKLILMSATIETARFSNYVSCYLKGLTDNNQQINSQEMSLETPIIHIPGRVYEVEEFYYEKIRSFINSNEMVEEDDIMESNISNEKKERISPPKRKNYRIPYDDMITLILKLKNNPGLNKFRGIDGSILVFLPGIAEIFRFINQFQYRLKTESNNINQFLLLPLHSSISNSEQKNVFLPPQAGITKIVVSTNIAEASITIPDVTIIIDSCLVKEMTVNPLSKLSSLVSVFASKDNLRQRKGRAGRVSEGRCFRFVTKNCYEMEIPDHGTPEMLRISVQRLLLQLQMMFKDSNQLNNYLLLYSCMDPPLRESVIAAENELMTLGALKSKDNGCEITSLGQHLSNLPCDPCIGKMLVYGSLLQCISTVSAIAACMTLKDPFLSSNDSEMTNKINSAKLKFAQICSLNDGGKKVKSDHLIFAETVRQFRLLNLNRSTNTMEAKKDFCLENGLSFDRMQEILLTQEDYVSALIDIGFLSHSSEDYLNPMNSPTSIYEIIQENKNSFDSRVVLSALCAGLYPTVCIVSKPPKKFTQTIGGALEKELHLSDIRFFVRNLERTLEQSEIQSPKIDELANLSEVFLHPESSLSSETKFQSSYLLFGTFASSFSVLNNSKIMIKDISEVSPFSLLLFGGSNDGDGIDVFILEGVVTIDNYLKFQSTTRIVAIIQSLRKAINQLLQKKISDPSFQICDEGNDLLTSIVTLISKDGNL